MTNHLHYGDNLTILRDSIASESVDLVYLDPPFNSNLRAVLMPEPGTLVPIRNSKQKVHDA